MKKNKVHDLAYGAVIASLYVALTHISNMACLANGAVQVRLSEALTILPVFTPSAVTGLFVGCILSNLTTGAIPLDIIGGSLATLIGAFGTYCMRKHPRLGVLPPILANTLIIPPVLMYGYGCEGSLPYFMLTVGIGELISCGVLGLLLLSALSKNGYFKNIKSGK